MANRLTDGEAQVGSLRMIGSDALKRVIMATVAVNPADLSTVTKAGTAVAVPGAKAGDFVIANPPAALEAGLLFVGARVTADDEVTIDLYNPTGGSVNGAERNWNFMIFGEA